MTELLLDRALDQEGVVDAMAEAVAIANRMLEAGLPKRFVIVALATALQYDGVLGLMQMWDEETEAADRAEVEADIQDMVDDCAKKGYSEGPYVRFDDLDAIAKDIRTFKDKLRTLVDERGGVTELARRVGMPQSSVSRFFNSASMPRRTTLNKFAAALGLSRVDIATTWTRD